MRYIFLLMLLSVASFALDVPFERIETGARGDINEIYFDNAAYGWAVTSQGELLSTFDGGKTWKVKSVTPRAITDIEFLDRVGYLCGEKGLIMKSTDRGATWRDISMNLKYNFSSVVIVNDSTVAVCGTDQNSMAKTRGVLYHSWDFGKNWTQAPRYSNGYADLAVTRPKKIYLLATKKVSHTISEGKAYFHGTYEGDRLAFDFDFIEDFGFMVGRRGLLDYSNSHGSRWEEIPLEVTKDLFAVEMFDPTSGVAVGQDGVVIFFYENGKRVSATHCGVNVDLYAVFATGERIFVGGRDGTLLFTRR